MIHEDFEDIEWLIREIEYSLENSEFTELASQSLRLQSIVQKQKTLTINKLLMKKT